VIWDAVSISRGIFRSCHRFSVPTKRGFVVIVGFLYIGLVTLMTLESHFVSDDCDY
jgi:hypothetical protein